MPTVKDFLLQDHGLEHEQYFQGCGVAFTRFDMVYTGIGGTAEEALDDALEQSYGNGDLWLSDTQEQRDVACKEFTTGRVVRKTEEHGDDVYYYVSVLIQYSKNEG